MKIQCIIPECSELAKSRGLCSKCYQVARYSIQKGKTTWFELEQNNLALPAENTGRGRTSKFNDAFLKMKENK